MLLVTLFRLLIVGEAWLVVVRARLLEVCFFDVGKLCERRGTYGEEERQRVFEYLLSLSFCAHSSIWAVYDRNPKTPLRIPKRAGH